MVINLIIEVLLTFVALGITTFSAAPIVFFMAPGARWLTKMVLSFVLGYALISLAGIFSAFLDFNPMILQCGMVLLGIAVFLRKRQKIICCCKRQLDQDDWIALGVVSLYLFLGLLFMDRIIIWMGGDALAHAEIIRMIMDGRPVPVSIPPLGSYWEYYPKGFHFYAYLWAKVFPILDVIRAIPILITAVTPMLLYSIVREIGRREEAIYALVLACFVFPAHYSNLIWAGYPTIAAEMLLVAALLSVLVDKRLLPIMLLGVLFTHGRLLVLAGAVLLIWQAAICSRRHRLPIAAGFGILVILIAAGLALFGHKPEFLISISTQQSLAGEYAARWYPAFLSFFGIVIAIFRRDGMDRLALSWSGAVVLMVLLADTGLLAFVGSADRLLLGLYLPLSLLGAFALSSMEGGFSGAISGTTAKAASGSKIVAGFSLRARTGFILVLLLCGAISMGAVFFSYANSWAIPKEDFQAIEWLGEQNYSDALCINLDETGAWVYPLTGIMVAKSRMWVAGEPLDLSLISKIVIDPSSPELAGALDSLGHSRYLIYISSISASRPGYVPPFAEYLQTYPAVNLSYPADRYDLIYHKGAYIFGFPKGAFS